MNNRRVCLIGMFPPPIHGMSLVNDYVNRCLSKKTKILVINYSPNKLGGKLTTRIYKFLRVSKCIFQFLKELISGRIGNIYIGLSGGHGQFYDLLFIGLSRFFLRPLYLHHHSYQYIDSKSLLTSILISISGKSATHIVACNLMASDLRKIYTKIGNVMVISGIATLDSSNADYVPRKEIRKVGFISNISLEKGILDFLEIAKWAQETNLHIKFIIAGPFESKVIKSVVEERLKVLNNTSYVGPLYSVEKSKFFDSMDVFLFPTKNESEGLVIHEAMSRGVPVITCARGCIGEIISNKSGIVVPQGHSYVSCAIAGLLGWLNNPKNYEIFSFEAYSQFVQARKVNIERMNKLCSKLIEGRK